ncbi:MD-2-related lipid-recognition protein-like [Hyposmocoma kahamanoa]|uniref:MD-2-related lipid-recognition protein-like n=1 Tax=Hyposmocoma kahamanoa TaxID=1477025 RepID=UPI000E6D6D99|nr:MD-2-related lipid-recognition protein-like [Hyposmocoma kahamanoa]
MRVVIFICALLTVINGEELDVHYCDGVGSEHCIIEKIRMTPCSTPKKECSIKRKFNASIEFDFTPKFVAENLVAIIVWTNGPTSEIEFPGFDKDGCKFTTCPTADGVTQSLLYSLHIGQKEPVGAYQLKWKLYDINNESNQCCFKFRVRVR